MRRRIIYNGHRLADCDGVRWLSDHGEIFFLGHWRLRRNSLMGCKTGEKLLCRAWMDLPDKKPSPNQENSYAVRCTPNAVHLTMMEWVVRGNAG